MFVDSATVTSLKAWHEAGDVQHRAYAMCISLVLHRPVVRGRSGSRKAHLVLVVRAGHLSFLLDLVGESEGEHMEQN